MCEEIMKRAGPDCEHRIAIRVAAILARYDLTLDEAAAMSDAQLMRLRQFGARCLDVLRAATVSSDHAARMAGIA